MDLKVKPIVTGNTPAVITKPVEARFNLAECVPSDWKIEKDGSHVICVHRITKRIFDGSIDDFNRLMKG